MAYNGSMGVPNQFMSAANMATDLGVNSHNQDATVASPNPATSPGVGANYSSGPSYMDALGNGGPHAVVDMARNQALKTAAQAAGKLVMAAL